MKKRILVVEDQPDSRLLKNVMDSDAEAPPYTSDIAVPAR